MTQTQIESLNHEEFTSLLAYGEPLGKLDQVYYQESGLDWISTLESTTYPDMTFGYIDKPYMYTLVC